MKKPIAKPEPVKGDGDMVLTIKREDWAKINDYLNAQPSDINVALRRLLGVLG